MRQTKRQPSRRLTTDCFWRGYAVLTNITSFIAFGAPAHRRDLNISVAEARVAGQSVRQGIVEG